MVLFYEELVYSILNQACVPNSPQWFNTGLHESYTSCTCTNCGTINKTEGKETLKCYSCEFTVDRDVAGDLPAS